MLGAVGPCLDTDRGRGRKMGGREAASYQREAMWGKNQDAYVGV